MLPLLQRKHSSELQILVLVKLDKLLLRLLKQVFKFHKHLNLQLKIMHTLKQKLHLMDIPLQSMVYQQPV